MRRIRSPRGAVVALVVAVAFLTWWLLVRTDFADGAAVANVLALPATIISVVVALVALYPRRTPDDLRLQREHLDRLRESVTTAEARALARLVGDVGDPRPAGLTFRQPELRRWRADGGADEDTLPRAADFYRSLRRGRLVVLGEPGAGKTVTAARLLLDLAVDHHRVPVRILLSDLPPLSSPTAAALDRCIAEYLTQVHGVPKDVASAIVGSVLPVLDGLDELPPHRAEAVLNALNEPTGVRGRPVVLTCRTADYSTPLEDATVVELQPLTTEQVIAWLTHRFPAASGDVRDKWRPVTANLVKHPNGRLAKALSSPLRLYLVAVVYQSPGYEPKDLLRLRADKLDEHLMSALVPALLHYHPAPRGYTVDRVRRWLSTVAQGASPRISTLLSTTSRWTAVLVATAAVAPLVVIEVVRFSRLGVISVDNVIVMSVLAFFGFGAGSAEWPCLPQNLSLIGRFGFIGATRAVRAWARIGIGLLATALVTLFWMDQRSLNPDPNAPIEVLGDSRVGLASGMSAFIIVTVVLALLPWDREVLSRPSDQVRKLVTADALRFAAVVLVPASAFIGMQVETGGPFGVDATATVVGVLMLGVPVAVIASAISPVPNHLVALLRARKGDRLPLRYGRFLDWARDVGLMRLSGGGVEFRHERIHTYFRA